MAKFWKHIQIIIFISIALASLVSSSGKKDAPNNPSSKNKSLGRQILRPRKDLREVELLSSGSEEENQVNKPSGHKDSATLGSSGTEEDRWISPQSQSTDQQLLVSENEPLVPEKILARPTPTLQRFTLENEGVEYDMGIVSSSNFLQDPERLDLWVSQSDGFNMVVSANALLVCPSRGNEKDNSALTWMKLIPKGRTAQSSHEGTKPGELLIYIASKEARMATTVSKFTVASKANTMIAFLGEDKDLFEIAKDDDMETIANKLVKLPWPIILLRQKNPKLSPIRTKQLHDSQKTPSLNQSNHNQSINLNNPRHIPPIKNQGNSCLTNNTNNIKNTNINNRFGIDSINNIKNTHNTNNRFGTNNTNNTNNANSQLETNQGSNFSINKSPFADQKGDLPNDQQARGQNQYNHGNKGAISFLLSSTPGSAKNGNSTAFNPEDTQKSTIHKDTDYSHTLIQPKTSFYKEFILENEKVRGDLLILSSDVFKQDTERPDLWTTQANGFEMVISTKALFIRPSRGCEDGKDGPKIESALDWMKKTPKGEVPNNTIEKGDILFYLNSEKTELVCFSLPFQIIQEQKKVPNLPTTNNPNIENWQIESSLIVVKELQNLPSVKPEDEMKEIIANFDPFPKPIIIFRRNQKKILPSSMQIDMKLGEGELQKNTNQIYTMSQGNTSISPITYVPKLPIYFTERWFYMDQVNGNRAKQSAIKTVLVSPSKISKSIYNEKLQITKHDNFDIVLAKDYFVFRESRPMNPPRFIKDPVQMPAEQLMLYIQLMKDWKDHNVGTDLKAGDILGHYNQKLSLEALYKESPFNSFYCKTLGDCKTVPLWKYPLENVLEEQGFYFMVLGNINRAEIPFPKANNSIEFITAISRALKLPIIMFRRMKIELPQND